MTIAPEQNRVVTLPNALTVLRGLAAIPIAMAVLSNRFGIAVIVIVLAGVSDGLDGWIARRLDQSSDVGRLLDPIADKVLLVVTFVVVSIPGRGFEPLPWWLATMAIGRDLLIVAAGFAIYRLTGFRGFTPTLLGKANTVFELVVVGLCLLNNAVGVPAWLMWAAIASTALSVVVSGLHYILHARSQLLDFQSRPKSA